MRWLTVMVLVLGCPRASSEVTCPPPPSPEVTATFDTGPLDQAWPGQVELPSAESAALVSSPSRRGGRALALTIKQGAVVNSGVRAELSWDAQDRAGTRAFYAWSLRLDPTWPDVDRVKDASGRPTWQILGQFHDQPDCERNETWDDYAGTGNSPPLTVQYLWLTKDDPSVQAIFDNGMAAGVVGLNDAALRRPLLGLFTGVPAQLRAVAPIEKGAWNDLRLAIDWSEGETGKVTWTLNDTEVIAWSGRNMINAAPHFFKVGLYRNPTIEGDQVLTVDEVFVSHDATRADAFARELSLTPR